MTNLTRWEPLRGLGRWDPFRELEELENRLSTLFGRTAVRDGGKEEIMTHAEWAPLVDISEDEKEYLITAELPQVKKDDVKVTMERGVLTLQGERKFEKEEKGRRYHRVERAYGNFVRSFTLPEDADAAKVNAEFKDGVLKVRVAKSEKALPKAVDIKVN